MAASAHLNRGDRPRPRTARRTRQGGRAARGCARGRSRGQGSHRVDRRRGRPRQDAARGRAARGSASARRTRRAGALLAVRRASRVRRDLRPLASSARDRDERADRDRTPHAHRKDRKSTRLNSSHVSISYAVFCLKKKKVTINVYGETHLLVSPDVPLLVTIFTGGRECVQLSVDISLIAECVVALVLTCFVLRR